MKIEEKIKILDENFIEHQITESGELIALCVMTTFAGDDCSEWISASEMIDAVKEREKYFKGVIK